MKNLVDLPLGDSLVRVLSNRARYISIRIALFQKKCQDLNHLESS
jgi:hypothetical protein